MSLGRVVGNLDGGLAYNTWLPADACAHQQGLPVRLNFHDLGQVSAQRLADQPARLVEDVVQVVGPEGQLAELGQDGLLPERL